MATGTFMVHAGGAMVDRVEVRRVATPEATESWQPVAHDRMIDLVLGSMTEQGLRIAKEEFALAKGGNQFFALFHLEGDKPDYNLVFGLRNSHDKTFPAALSLGSRVFGQATAALIEARGVQHKRIEAYKATAIDDTAAHDFVVRSARLGYLPGSNIADVVEEWHKPSHEEFAPRTGWSLFNAYTEVGKRWGRALPARTTRLHGMFDNFCGVTSALAALQLAAGEDAEIVVNN